MSKKGKHASHTVKKNGSVRRLIRRLRAEERAAELDALSPYERKATIDQRKAAYDAAHPPQVA
jgi:hypothetical protein